MSEEQYKNDIKTMVLSSLKTEYPATTPNKIELEKTANEAIIKLLQNEPLFNEIAEQSKNWSYYQSESNGRPKKPEIAKGFLNKIMLRDFAIAYIKKYEQNLQNIKNQTR